MKKIVLFIIITWMFSSCQQRQDVIVADIYNQKLYLSEIQKFFPEGISKEDSVKLSDRLINEWIKKQVLLHEANAVLSVKEKNFSKEIENLKNDLLINAYFQKLTADSSLFTVTDSEIKTFLEQYPGEGTTEREIVKLNYVKLSNRSKIANEMKGILFNEQRRISEKALIEKICADSIEYFIDDLTWLFLDDIQAEIPLAFDKSLPFPNQIHIEKNTGKNIYLIVLLDYDITRNDPEDPVNFAMARSLLLQQKKTAFIQEKVRELFQAAIDEQKVIR